MKTKNSRVGEYVLVDTLYSREESVNSLSWGSRRYFGSDGMWHRTLRETPSWKTRADVPGSMLMAYGRGRLHYAKIVEKKKPASIATTRATACTTWDIVNELGRRYNIKPDDIGKALNFVQDLKNH